MAFDLFTLALMENIFRRKAFSRNYFLIWVKHPL